MAIFSKIRNAKKAADEQRKSAPPAPTEPNPPGNKSYKHVPTHAAQDARAGSPQSETDVAQQIQEQRRRLTELGPPRAGTDRVINSFLQQQERSKALSRQRSASDLSIRSVMQQQQYDQSIQPHSRGRNPYTYTGQKPSSRCRTPGSRTGSNISLSRGKSPLSNSITEEDMSEIPEDTSAKSSEEFASMTSRSTLSSKSSSPEKKGRVESRVLRKKCPSQKSLRSSLKSSRASSITELPPILQPQTTLPAILTPNPLPKGDLLPQTLPAIFEPTHSAKSNTHPKDSPLGTTENRGPESGEQNPARSPVPHTPSLLENDVSRPNRLTLHMSPVTDEEDWFPDYTFNEPASDHKSSSKSKFVEPCTIGFGFDSKHSRTLPTSHDWEDPRHMANPPERRSEGIRPNPADLVDGVPHQQTSQLQTDTNLISLPVAPEDAIQPQHLLAEENQNLEQPSEEQKHGPTATSETVADVLTFAQQLKKWSQQSGYSYEVSPTKSDRRVDSPISQPMDRFLPSDEPKESNQGPSVEEAQPFWPLPPNNRARIQYQVTSSPTPQSPNPHVPGQYPQSPPLPEQLVHHADSCPAQEEQVSPLEQHPHLPRKEAFEAHVLKLKEHQQFQQPLMPRQPPDHCSAPGGQGYFPPQTESQTVSSKPPQIPLSSKPQFVSDGSYILPSRTSSPLVHSMPEANGHTYSSSTSIHETYAHNLKSPNALASSSSRDSDRRETSPSPGYTLYESSVPIPSPPAQPTHYDVHQNSGRYSQEPYGRVVSPTEAVISRSHSRDVKSRSRVVSSTLVRPPSGRLQDRKLLGQDTPAAAVQDGFLQPLLQPRQAPPRPGVEEIPVPTQVKKAKRKPSRVLTLLQGRYRTSPVSAC